MFAFTQGAKLIMQLSKFLGEPVQVEVDFGLINHMCVYDLNEEDKIKLVEVDTLTIGEEDKPLTTDHLDQLVDHMEKLKDHEVFRWDRSFFQEGFGIYLKGQTTAHTDAGPVVLRKVMGVQLWWLIIFRSYKFENG